MSEETEVYLFFKSLFLKSKKYCSYTLCCFVLFQTKFSSVEVLRTAKLMLLSPDLLPKAHLPAAYPHSSWSLIVTYTLIIATYNSV